VATSIKALILFFALPCALVADAYAGNFWVPSAHTAYWDVTPNNGTIDDGAGTWNSTNVDWTYETGVKDSVFCQLCSVNFGGGSTGAAGTVTLSGTQTISNLTFTAANGGGNYTLTGGTLAIPVSSTVTVTGQSPTISTVITGAGSITKAGAGPLTLSATNTYSGGTTINAGTLAATTSSSLGTGAIAIGSSGTLTWTGIGNTTISNALSGTGVFNVTPAASDDAIFGSITAFSGTLNVNGSSSDSRMVQLNTALGTGVIVNVNSGALLDLYVAGTFNGTFNLAGPGNNSGQTFRMDAGSYISATSTVNLLSNVTINAAVGLGGTIAAPISDGANTYSISLTGVKGISFSGTNTYKGTTTISMGNGLTINGSGSLGAGNYSANIVDTTTLFYSSSAAQTLSGVISGAGALTKASSTSVLTLTGANTYAGATAINQGEIQFNAANTGTGTITASGGTLAGSGTVAGAVTIANSASSKIRGGTGSGSTATLTLSSSLTFSGATSAVDVTTNGTSSTSQISVGGTTALGGCKINILGAIGTGTYSLITSTGTMSGTLCVLGTNSSGHTVAFSQVGNILKMTVS
jgi:autotransporter-associated beta strand protein